MDTPLKILVADDSDSVLLFVSQIISELGHQPILARDGIEAVELFMTENPDMVLMDVVMPNMDGCEATTRIKQLAGSRWVPVVFMSARDSVDDQLLGFASGGDDYIVKPIRQRFLAAKIKATQRFINLNRTVRSAVQQLAEYHSNNEREQELAKSLMEKIIGAHRLDSSRIERWIRPANRFSGDIIAAERTANDEMHLLIADVTGHGLAAAVNLLPVVEVFYTMTRKGHSIANISREVNSKLRQFLPTEYFVAAAMVAIDYREGLIEVWNGGMPPPYFVDDQGEVLHQWNSSHLPLGILPDSDFETTTEAFEWPRPGRLMLYSDGLLEVENSEGVRFGAERIKESLRAAPGALQFAHLVETANRFMDVERIKDDISLASVKCVREQVDADQAAAAAPASRAKLSIELGAPEFRSFDASSWVTSWFEQLRYTRKQCQELFLILSELYNNALDHGILGLDSSLKSHDDDGFAKYLDLRRERLEQLQRGNIRIELERLEVDSEPHLKLTVCNDTSEFSSGFAPQETKPSDADPFGRGIFLVKSLCSKVEYTKQGNRVEALYRLR